MFEWGTSIKVTGSPHRDNPTACTVDTMTIGNAPALERYQQLSDARTADRAKRPFRLSNGKPNLAGDFEQEQQVLARPPGGRAGLVPISQAAAINAGKLPMPAGPAGWFGPPVKLTAAGQAAADALRKRPTSDNPRLSCQVTSILFDWVFDGAIGRITQSATAVKMEYGVGLTRTVHLNMTAHPAKVAAEPRRSLDRPMGRRYARRGHCRLLARAAWQATFPTATNCTSSSASRSIPRRLSSRAASSPKIPSTSRTSPSIR